MDKSLASISVEFAIGLAIGIYILASILPGAITNLIGAQTSEICVYMNTSFNSSVTNCTGADWSTSTIALWGIVPLIIIVVLLIVLYRGKGN